MTNDPNLSIFNQLERETGSAGRKGSQETEKSQPTDEEAKRESGAETPGRASQARSGGRNGAPGLDQKQRAETRAKAATHARKGDPERLKNGSEKRGVAKPRQKPPKKHNERKKTQCASTVGPRRTVPARAGCPVAP